MLTIVASSLPRSTVCDITDFIDQLKWFQFYIILEHVSLQINLKIRVIKNRTVKIVVYCTLKLNIL